MRHFRPIAEPSGRVPPHLAGVVKILHTGRRQEHPRRLEVSGLLLLRCRLRISSRNLRGGLLLRARLGFPVFHSRDFLTVWRVEPGAVRFCGRRAVASGAEVENAVSS